MKELMYNIAEMYGIGFKDLGDKVKFYIHFNPDFEWHDVHLIFWWKHNQGNLLNWWRDYCFDGKHRIVGPGYPAYAIHDQKPIRQEEFISMVDKEVGDLAKHYKQFKHRI